MRALSFLSVCIVVTLFAVPAMGQIDSFFDVFFVQLDGDVGNWNALNTSNSGGSGWPSVDGDPDVGDWIWYEGLAGPGQMDDSGNPNPDPSWWNEWFYDGKFRPERYKEVDIVFDYTLVDTLAPGGANIVVNWSNELWFEGGPAGQEYTIDAPPMSNEFIGREEIARLWMPIGDPGGQYTIDNFRLPAPYNPEWVSIDVTGYNIAITGGHVDHLCIPEPGTIALLITGGLGMLVYAWRRRRSA